MSKDKLRKKWGVETSDSNDKSPDSTSKSPANENKSSTIESKYFMVDTDSPIVTSLKVMCRDGRVLYMPYSHQPLIEYVPEDGIYIKTLQKVILIVGRNLSELIDMLGMQKVKWIKESATGKDDGSEGLFVEKIEVTDP